MADIDERTKKAFDFYADSTKQLITLSTAIIALMITFAKDILKPADGYAKFPLISFVVYSIATIHYSSV